MSNDYNFNDQFQKMTGTRIVETEEQAKEVLTEVQAEVDRLQEMDPKERKLEQYKQAKAAFEQLDQYYRKLDRRGRRKLAAKVNPGMKFSSQVKKILKKTK